MKTAAIFGRGFGLYGHAVALSLLNWRVLLPISYRNTVVSRKELSCVVSNFEYYDDISSMVAECQFICLARRPLDNIDLLLKLINKGINATFIIEKPLAQDPTSSLAILDVLHSNRLRFSTPYLFLYTDWFSLLSDAINSGQKCKVIWTHYPSNNLNSWKFNPFYGGGTLGFYIIHMFALFQELGIALTNIKQTGDHWLLLGHNLEIVFELGNSSNFIVSSNDETIFHEKSPFGVIPKPNELDPRVPALMKFYTASQKSNGITHDFDFHRNVFMNWQNGINGNSITK